MNVLLVVIPLGLQAAATLLDEFCFHWQRRLPRWERIGHPLDTSTVVLCQALALTTQATSHNLQLYLVAAAFSCLFITKDEFVHAKACSPVEHWLHAVLFVLHPLALGSIAWLWFHGFDRIIAVQLATTLLFGVYQTVYWNTTWLTRRTVQ